MSEWGQLNLVDPASPMQQEMLLFHDHGMALLLGIFSFVVIISVSLFTSSFSSRTMSDAQTLEFIWTVIPVGLLLYLALPSLRLLYVTDTSHESGVTLKSIAHQWYWEYEMPSLTTEVISSYMVPDEDLSEKGMYRLLEVSQRATVPYGMNNVYLTTSADVLHAFALPSLGVKMDAIPGRINSQSAFMSNPGIYYGQCSELCGANHSFMPIVVEAVKI